MSSSALSPANATLLTASMEQPASPVRELTAALARGDDSAWSQFHRDYGPGIFRQLLAATRGDHDLAGEALQQTYLRVARHARPCDIEAVFLGWLRVVARSALNDCLRRRRSFLNLLNRRHADPTDSPPPVAAEDELLAALDAALAEIGADNRALLEAKYFSAISVRTLAAKLAVSEKAVESRLTRARAELRDRLLAILPRHE